MARDEEDEEDYSEAAEQVLKEGSHRLAHQWAEVESVEAAKGRLEVDVVVLPWVMGKIDGS